MSIVAAHGFVGEDASEARGIPAGVPPVGRYRRGVHHLPTDGQDTIAKAGKLKYPLNNLGLGSVQAWLIALFGWS